MLSELKARTSNSPTSTDAPAVVTATTTGTKRALDVAIVSGSAAGPLSPPAGTDAVGVAYPNTTHEVYSFFSGGLAGTLLMTLTLTYSDASKTNLTSVVKT